MSIPVAENSVQSPLQRLWLQFRVPILGIIALGIIGFVVIQLIPVTRTNPPVVKEPSWDSPQTRTLAARACFDCHSNETVWPWYTSIAPVSWLTAHDVNEGRSQLNFSEWQANRRRANQIASLIRQGEMPPWYYVMMHPDAKLSDAEKNALIDGMTKTVAQN